MVQRYLDSLRKRLKLIVAEKSPKESLYHLARLVAYGEGFLVPVNELIGDIAIPLLVLEKTGDVAVRRSTALRTDLVKVVPNSLARGWAETILSGWASRKWLQGKTSRIPWSGGSCVFAEGVAYLLRIDKAESLNPVEQLHKAWLAASHYLTGVRFLSPGKKKEPPLIQELWLSKKFHNRKSKECDQATDSVKTALKANTDLAKLRYEFGYHSPKFVEFAAPFGKFFTAGWQYLNVLHPAVKALAECIGAVTEKQSAGTISDHDLGTICDALQPLFGRGSRWSPDDYHSGSRIEEKCEGIRRLFDLTSELEIFEVSADLPWANESLNIPSVVGAGKLGAPILSLREVGLE